MPRHPLRRYSRCNTIKEQNHIHPGRSTQFFGCQCISNYSIVITGTKNDKLTISGTPPSTLGDFYTITQNVPPTHIYWLQLWKLCRSWIQPLYLHPSQPFHTIYMYIWNAHVIRIRRNPITEIIPTRRRTPALQVIYVLLKGDDAGESQKWLLDNGSKKVAALKVVRSKTA